MLRKLVWGCTVCLAASLARAEDLRYPVDVAVDAKGAVFVADHEAHTLLRWANGTFEVVARGEGLPRTPLYGIRHIALGKDGAWVASDPATMKLYRIGLSGSIEPIPDDDRFVTPWGVAVEASGAILVVDRVTHRLRRIKPGGEVEDVAEVKAPRVPFLDKKGNLFVLTDDNVSRIEAGQAKPLLENPPFEFPHDAVVHPDGSIYVTDGYARAIWRIRPEHEVTSLVRGEPFESPQGLAVDGKGNLLVADAHAKRVFVVSTQGQVSPLSAE